MKPRKKPTLRPTTKATRRGPTYSTREEGIHAVKRMPR
jgi:hypothetical protein